MRTLPLLAALLLFDPAAATAQPVFDTHIHLWDGEKSLGEYQAHVKAAGLTTSGLGVMWFGGPNQAREGNPADIAARNDALIALAAKHQGVVPIATV